MCGIVGVYDGRGNLPSPEVLADSMRRLLLRGPDDTGTWSDRHVRLGHRRLAVVDLSPAGHQPMCSADGRFVLVFNGEIYNHLDLRRRLTPAGGWRGTSDTETLLAAWCEWGPACLERLNGMFAFALWDAREGCLFLARDRLGVKPLYYSWSNGRLSFASRPVALLPLTGRSDFDEQALRCYLELGHIPAPMSFYSQMRKLEPAHYLRVDARGTSLMRYWDYRGLQPQASLLARPQVELVDELDELLRDATRVRLLSDVPLGVFLSGGVDSACVAAQMKAVGVSTPKAYTICFHEPDYDEGGQAAIVARHLGVHHVTETLSVEDLLGLLPLYVEEFDEPFADSSAFPTMAVARLARSEVTVALTGDGADELFGGYHYYKLAGRLAGIGRLPAPARTALRELARRLPLHRARLLAGALAVSGPVETFHYLRSFSKDFTPLLDAGALARTRPSLDWYRQCAAGFAPGLAAAETGMRLDLAFMLADGYLQKVDLATMSASLEARNPFLDYRLVEWSMRLPQQLKMRGGVSKYLLKKVLERYLPADLIHRPKRGFGVPVARWLRGPLRAWALELLHDRTLMSRLPLRPQGVLSLFDSHDRGERDAHPLLWAVLMLLCYVARHDCGAVLPPLQARAA